MYINPYENFNEMNWQKGNFHVHAGTGPNTCGVNPIEDVLKAYKGAGYNVICISNHDIYSDTSELAKQNDMVLINGFEYSQAAHMLCIGVENVIFANHQEAIDKTNAQGGFAVINHPNWKVGDVEKYNFSYYNQLLNQPYGEIDIPLHWPLEEIEKLSGYIGVEIFNGVLTRLMGAALAVDVWDSLLSGGKVIWGFGNDDFHQWFDIAKVATVVSLNEYTKEDAIKAIKAGRTYVSIGLKLDKFEFDGKTITVEASTYNGFRGEMYYKFIGKNGTVLKEGYNNTYTLKGEEMYVRVEIVNAYGAKLWTQPIYKATAFK